MRINWFDRWFYRQCKKAWQMKDSYEESENGLTIKGLNTMAMGQAISAKQAQIEGQDTIHFDLSSAVGGHILNVRRYDDRKDRNDRATYVIASGEDIGARVTKIINLELLK